MSDGTNGPTFSADDIHFTMNAAGMKDKRALDRLTDLRVHLTDAERDSLLLDLATRSQALLDRVNAFLAEVSPAIIRLGQSLAIVQANLPRPKGQMEMAIEDIVRRQESEWDE